MAMKTISAAERRALPELVVAQIGGAMGVLALALDQLLPAGTRRYKIVDRDLTRC